MPSIFKGARAVAGQKDEGRRALRNLLSFGGFVFAPLSVRWTSAALGGDGYGRWWWTFGLLEAGGMLGMLGADLFIRREVPRLVEAGDEEGVHQTVGSGLAALGAAGLLLAVLQCLLTAPVTRAQGDPALAPFLLVLSTQPILWNLGNALGCALQSMNVLAALAVLRGVVLPALQIALLYACARGRLGTLFALGAMMTVSVVGVVATMALYARHLPLRRTFACALRPRLLRPLLAFGAPLLLPSLLWTVGAKLDLYVLGRIMAPERIGVYAACLQLAALVPALRGVLDPVAQTEIGALHRGPRRAELAGSLRRMARLAAIGGGLPLAVLVTVGAPLLARLLHRPVPETAAPLAILAAGQFIGAIAIGSWLLPMTYPSRMTALVAGTTLVVKLALLLLLVPRLGLVGAALATTAGTIIAQQGQALLAARDLDGGPYPASLLVVVVVTALAALVIRGAFVAQAGAGDVALTLAIGAGALVFAGATLALLAPDERRALRAFLGRGQGG